LATSRLEEEVKTRADRADSLAVSMLLPSQYDAVRTENNKFIREAKAALDDAKKVCLESWIAAEDAYLTALAPLEEANRRLGDRILNAKDAHFKASAEGFYNMLLGEVTARTGAIPDWWPSFERAWGEIKERRKTRAVVNATKEDVRKAILAFKPTTRTVTLSGAATKIQQVISYAIGLGVYSEADEILGDDLL